ncbi:hypothetical protein ACFPYJ_10120 [Paenibacillus solisilvae]|uniref:HTH araC/xylS-type domain-containing protein n=1 Tax=Paenibacillus solisilvae TaxID=2486751 RepID=A0ABW0VYC2_9BACL
MPKAAEPLRTNQLLLTDLGVRCGYNYTSEFGKVFNKIAGMSSSAFRETVEGQVEDYLLQVRGSPIEPTIE